MQSISDVLETIEIEENIVKMPQLDRKLYLQVIKQLETLGGRWDKKAKGIVFSDLSGEALRNALLEINQSPDLRKKYQFFETPPTVAKTIVQHAQLKPYHRILEPSAGRGALIEAAIAEIPAAPLANINAIEIWDTNVEILRRKFSPRIKITQGDFLEIEKTDLQGRKYDRIVANPPFNKNQDIDHVRKMYECLVLGGRLVSITSTHWTFAKDKKCEHFREWLIDVDANVFDIDSNSFEHTEIATKLIVIDKALYQQP